MPSVFRVCRTEAPRPSAAPAQDAPLHARYADIAASLRANLPETIAGLFAQPIVSADGGWIDWCTGLPGQPQPMASLPPDERARIAALLKERLESVRALAGRLPDPERADLLRRAAVDPGLDQVYVLSGQPVIVDWGRAGNGAAAIPAVPVPPPAPAAAAAPAAVAATSRWRWWALAGLLLLILLAALFLLSRCAETPPPVPPPAVAEPPKDDGDGLDELRAKIKAAEDEIRRRLDSCPVPPAPAPAPEIKPETPAPEPVPAPPPVPVPKPAKPEPKPVAPKPAAPKPSETQAPPAKTQPAPETKPQRTACPEPRKSWERPEVMLMIDGSGSMRLPKDMSEAAVDALIRRAMAGDRAAMATLMGHDGGRGSRLEAAKEAARQGVNRMPGDVDIGLLVFGRCEGTDNFKFFSPGQRPALLSRIDSIRPEEGTPLARGLERSGNMLDGVNVPGVIVVVTDGEDSCGGDPCAVARALKQKKPNLKVNVIGVGGSGKGRCMADVTGGRFFTPRDGEAWNDILMKATEQAPKPAGCD
ncbi:MAG: VWA domain-containing protein [Rhodospirillaceae bacterium]|nr:VWA domain-containing protein [Rhodospirillaceae bacterium]